MSLLYMEPRAYEFIIYGAMVKEGPDCSTGLQKYVN